MPKTEFQDFSSQERLVENVLDIWANQGQAALSARLLSRMTGLPTSSIYHHFGSMEQLCQSAQAYARDAAERWCDARLADLSPWPQGDGADSPEPVLARALAALIDDWTIACRRLAFAWSECQLLAQRDPAYIPALDAWRDLWSRFWREVCARAGLGDRSALTAHMFEGASQLHLIRWRRTVDRAALEEFCEGWGRWLSGRLAPERAWRRFARDAALNAAPEALNRSGVAAAISEAAADIVEEGGVAALTHRAVAARAEVTLGVVSYNFRTSADLARTAFDTIYWRLTQGMTGQAPAPESQPAAQSPQAVFEREEILSAWHDLGAQPRGLVAMEELTLAVARDADLQDFAPQLRYLRGRSSALRLRALLGDAGAQISPLDAAIYSGLITGQRRALIGRSPAEIHASLDEMDRLMENLRAGGAS